MSLDWIDIAAGAQEHRSTAEVFAASGYIRDWARLTFENGQSNILGDAALIIPSAYLLYKGSGMTREGDDEIEEALQRFQHAFEAQPTTGQAPPVTVEGIVQGTRPTDRSSERA